MAFGEICIPVRLSVYNGGRTAFATRHSSQNPKSYLERYPAFLTLLGASSSTNEVMLRADCDVGSESSPSLLGTGLRLTAAPPAIDGLFGDDDGPPVDMIVFKLGDVGIVGVPNACWLVLAVCSVSSDGELGILRGAFDRTLSGTGGAGGEACCCCNCDS